MVAAARVPRCASTSARSATGVTSGASPFTTTTGASPSSSPAAASTAPPVPFGSGWTAGTTPSGSRPSSAPSAEPTTTTFPAPASSAAATVQSIMGRPQISWSIFGVRERMRVPWPAARISTVGSVTALRLEAGCGIKRLGRHLLGMLRLRAPDAGLRHDAVLGLVRAAPLADGVVADAVLPPDAAIPECLDLANKLLVGRPHRPAPPRLRPTAPRRPLTTRPRAVALPRRPREERRAALGARQLGRRHPAVAPAMRVERGVAVRADDPQVPEPVVVMHAVDVVEDQGHAAPAPRLALTAQLTAPVLDPLREEALLEASAWIRGAFDQRLGQRQGGSRERRPASRVRVEVVDRDAPAPPRVGADRGVVAARRSHPEPPQRLGIRPRCGD